MPRESGSPSCPRRSGCRVRAGRCQGGRGKRGRFPGCRAARASSPPGTGSSAAAGWGSCRSDRPAVAARAEGTRLPTVRDRSRAGRCRGGRCPRPPPCRRAAAERNPVRPRSPQARSTAPEKSKRRRSMFRLGTLLDLRFRTGKGRASIARAFSGAATLCCRAMSTRCHRPPHSTGSRIRAIFFVRAAGRGNGSG